MSFQKVKSDSYCVGGRHRSAISIIYGVISSKGCKVLIGYCSICIRKKPMTISDNTIQAKGLGDIFKNLGKKGLRHRKRMRKTCLQILEELWISRQTLQLQIEIPKMFYQHYTEQSISITPEKGFTLASLYKLSYKNGPKM